MRMRPVILTVGRRRTVGLRGKDANGNEYRGGDDRAKRSRFGEKSTLSHVALKIVQNAGARFRSKAPSTALPRLRLIENRGLQEFETLTNQVSGELKAALSAAAETKL